ncbi:MAG: hypothetical protein NT042_07045 [Sulfuritalea sp.]|nr:hypothetical protein [Sulfuritalea sp.]
MTQSTDCAAKICTDKAFFITLHRHGQFSNECISNGIIRLLNEEIPHQLCIDGNWDEARKHLAQTNRLATQHLIQQVRTFYEPSGSTLWISSDLKSLWWCFAEPVVSISADGSRMRKAIDGWRDKDIRGGHLFLDRVDRDRLQVRSHMFAISRIKDIGYLLDLINGDVASSTNYYKD